MSRGNGGGTGGGGIANLRLGGRGRVGEWMGEGLQIYGWGGGREGEGGGEGVKWREERGLLGGYSTAFSGQEYFLYSSILFGVLPTNQIEKDEFWASLCVDGQTP